VTGTLQIAAWAIVAYVALAIFGGIAGIVGAIILRRRALRDFEARRKEIAEAARPPRERFKP